MEIIVALLSFSSIFFLVMAVAGWSGLIENPVARRVNSLRPGARAAVRERGFRHHERFASALEAVGHKVAPKSDKDRSDCEQRLRLAGFYGETAFYVYWGVRLMLAAALPAAAFLLMQMRAGFPVHPAMAMLFVSGIGFIAPDVYLRYRKNGRQEKIFCGLPDALDLLVVCLEAGLGLDAALQKVSEEFHISNPVLSSELQLSCAAIRLGQPRNEALRELGERTGVMDLKALVAVLIQADRFGTSSADALRVHSKDMRTRRRQRAEELAAKTTVKLIFPLVLFIFPAIFVVIAGPAVIRIMENIDKL